ncbi:MAG: hypothetical protein ACI4QT_04775 [Kiritimatiellia bacterium]
MKPSFALRAHPLFLPATLCIVSLAFLLATFGLRRTFPAQLARIATVRAETASLSPDLERLRQYNERRINILDRLDTRPPRFKPADIFSPYSDTQPSVTEAERRLPISGLRIRTTELACQNIPPDNLARAINAAIADGHRITAIELASGAKPRCLRARIRFLTFLPQPVFTPIVPIAPPVVTPAGAPLP